MANAFFNEIDLMQKYVIIQRPLHENVAVRNLRRSQAQENTS